MKTKSFYYADTTQFNAKIKSITPFLNSKSLLDIELELIPKQQQEIIQIIATKRQINQIPLNKNITYISGIITQITGVVV